MQIRRMSRSIRRSWSNTSVSKVAALLVPAAFGFGCSVVETDLPLPRAENSSVQHQVEGTWVGDDGVIHLRFAEPGFGKIAFTEWDGESFSLEHGELILSGSGERHFVSTRFLEDGKWSKYYLAEINLATTDVDYLLVWIAEADPFREAIEAGRLHGSSEEPTITSTPEELLRVISDAHTAFFNYRDPLILRRLFERSPLEESTEAPEAGGNEGDVTPGSAGARE